MDVSNVVSKDEQDLFWCKVQQCIQWFHPGHLEKSLHSIIKLYRQVEKMDDEQKLHFYHSEPFYVACNITNNHIDIGNYLEEYLEIMNL